jgi:hypothetical protein
MSIAMGPLVEAIEGYKEKAWNSSATLNSSSLLEDEEILNSADNFSVQFPSLENKTITTLVNASSSHSVPIQ